MDKLDIELLDQLNQPALVVNKERQPVYLTPAGALILQIRARDKLGDYRELLEPLIGVKAAALPPGVPTEEKRIQELSLHTTEGVPIPALASELDYSKDGLRIVVFWDLRPFQSWFLAMQQAQRTRPSLVYASAILGQMFNQQAVEALLMHQAVDLSSRFNATAGIDLLHALTRSIEIVDSLVSPTFRIHLSVSTSALLQVSQVAGLRIFAHLLLEAFDYAGPLGRARVSAFFHDGRVQVLVLGSRQDRSGLELNVLEQYLSRRALSTDYRVRQGEGGLEILAEEKAFLEKHLGPKEIMKFDLIRTLPEVSYSENLRIAASVAEAANARFTVRLDPPRHILLSVNFAMVGAAGSGTKRPTVSAK